MTATTLDTATPVGAAVREARASVAGLVTVVRQYGLDHHDPAWLVGLLDEVEVLRNQLSAVDADLIAACRDAGVPERECQRSMAKVLERRVPDRTAGSLPSGASGRSGRAATVDDRAPAAAVAVRSGRGDGGRDDDR